MVTKVLHLLNIDLGPIFRCKRKGAFKSDIAELELFLFLLSQAHQELCHEEENLDSTDEREASQESKSSSNS